MTAWQNAMDLAVSIHELTSTLPRSEDYGLTSQMRRSAVSITDNIAEGFGRRTKKDKSHFYVISRGSAHELKNQLIYGNRVKYFTKKESTEYIKNVEQIILELNRLMKSLQ